MVRGVSLRDDTFRSGDCVLAEMLLWTEALLACCTELALASEWEVREAKLLTVCDFLTETFVSL